MRQGKKRWPWLRVVEKLRTIEQNDRSQRIPFTNAAIEDLQVCAGDVYGLRRGFLPPKTRARAKYDRVIVVLTEFPFTDVAVENLQACASSVYELRGSYCLERKNGKTTIWSSALLDMADEDLQGCACVIYGL